MTNRGNSIAESIADLVGGTPMVFLNSRLNTTKARIALKLESENPMASVKDRLALSIIKEAEKKGDLIPGKSVIIEATSGNTGIGLAHLGAVLGYKVILTMPETMSQERRCLLKILGAEVVLTPAAKGMAGAVKWAQKLVQETPNAYYSDQFETAFNSKIHYETTGPEIWAQTQGKVDIFVAGVGTGGTLTGVSTYLKEQNPEIKIFAIEPDESPVISGGKPGPHKIQGLGAGFIPGVLDKNIINEVVRINSDQAMTVARKLPTSDGIFCGISGGAAVCAALEIASRPESEGKLIVTVIPSFGERYLSTLLFQNVRDEVSQWPVVPVTEFQ